MAAEVLTRQIPTAKPDDGPRPDAEQASAGKRNYVPIRPAYRPLLPKPSTRQSSPSPIHIHTRTSGLSQLSCRKRNSSIVTKLDAAKRRRSLNSRAADSHTTQQDAKDSAAPSTAAAAGVAAAGDVSAQVSTRSSPSPPSSVRSPASVSSPGVDSPNLTSVSTRSIFGPPPPQGSVDTMSADILSPFEADSSKPQSLGGTMTSMMSALVGRLQQQQTSSSTPAAASSSEAAAGETTSIADTNDQESSVFSQLQMDSYDDELPLSQLDLEQFSKLDMDLGSASSAAASLASSAVTSTSMATSDALAPVASSSSSSIPEDFEKITSQSPDAFGSFASPTAEFDEFTDFYFRSGTHSYSVTPTDGSPETLGDALDTEVALSGKDVPGDDLAMMEFLAPVDLFNA